MKTTPEQTLDELALLPHDQPIRPKRTQKHHAKAVTDSSQIDALLRDIIIAAETNLTPTQ